eukprot:CAMPEP_0185577540 /NCGR_PEP_ID=MMETSP0434-20130131/10413_1 /TAXON_ID=626734 ORGANISM="Favella taraikaensis, Strain Fe Narragansett Bay" /NCGR_SAMPLE_ID=MMETSP0434 /ASSEMBLY_ACC=CAM_ASM_000379 /LENGTH=205 /DNA_ID=CAMNT_0028195139 /DNA_START=335 /DNA_END=955 /DNA_ORIENTATION=-
MYKAMKSTEVYDDDEMNTQMMDFNTSSKLHNLKAARQLATEITESGAKLHDMLGAEREMRAAREKALEFLDSISRNLDRIPSSSTSRSVSETLLTADAQDGGNAGNSQVAPRRRGRAAEHYLEKARRAGAADKRLKGIENVKPEFQEEYERLEAELERFYGTYVEKYTNIDYLEYELDMYNLKDSQRRAKQEKVIEKLKDQHLKN